MRVIAGSSIPIVAGLVAYLKCLTRRAGCETLAAMERVRSHGTGPGRPSSSRPHCWYAYLERAIPSSLFGSSDVGTRAHTRTHARMHARTHARTHARALQLVAPHSSQQCTCAG